MCAPTGHVDALNWTALGPHACAQAAARLLRRCPDVAAPPVPYSLACACLQGYSVLLSNYRRYFSLAGYLSTFTRESIVIAMGIPSLAVSGRAACGGCMLSTVCTMLLLHLWGSLRSLALPGMFPSPSPQVACICVWGSQGRQRVVWLIVCCTLLTKNLGFFACYCSCCERAKTICLSVMSACHHAGHVAHAGQCTALRGCNGL